MMSIYLTLVGRRNKICLSATHFWFDHKVNNFPPLPLNLVVYANHFFPHRVDDGREVEGEGW